MCWADDSEGRFNALNDLESFPIARGRAALPPPSRGRTRPSCVMQAPESEPLLEHGVFSHQRPICSDGCSRAASASRPMNAAVIGSSFDRSQASGGAAAKPGSPCCAPRRRRQTASSTTVLRRPPHRAAGRHREARRQSPGRRAARPAVVGKQHRATNTALPCNALAGIGAALHCVAGTGFRFCRRNENPSLLARSPFRPSLSYSAI